ncbi:hypothetical protein BC940DRAFT_292713 [Gongronella butleri]|nr:hypothetical protein BC940DRAFT_292713 [Gongronella butleri]
MENQYSELFLVQRLASISRHKIYPSVPCKAEMPLLKTLHITRLWNRAREYEMYLAQQQTGWWFMQESYLSHLDSSLMMGFLDDQPPNQVVDDQAPPSDVHVSSPSLPDDSALERRRRHQASLLSHTPVFTDASLSTVPDDDTAATPTSTMSPPSTPTTLEPLPLSPPQDCTSPLAKHPVSNELQVHDNAAPVPDVVLPLPTTPIPTSTTLIADKQQQQQQGAKRKRAPEQPLDSPLPDKRRKFEAAATPSTPPPTPPTAAAAASLLTSPPASPPLVKV